MSDIFKNEMTGDRYQVTCDYYDSLGSKKWTVRVDKCPKGKRKFLPLVNEDSWGFRNATDRDAYRYREYIKEIPWAWVEKVMDDVLAEIKNLTYDIYPKDE